MIYILLSLNLVGIGIAILLLLKFKNSTELRSLFREERDSTRNSEKLLRDEINGSFKSLSDSVDKRMDNFGNKLNDLIDKNNENSEKMRGLIEKKLENIQKDNGDKLEQMRKTVGDKLDESLEKRFTESFKVISDRLDTVHKGLWEMQNLAIGVGDLKKVLSNVKTRWTWWEAQLENLISEIFTPEQYDKNVKTKKWSGDNVEFALKLPGNSDESKYIWLPIDAKFPLEDYQRLLEAQEQGDIDSINSLGKSLEARIKSEAKDINEKYIEPPFTTDFGILFVPIESLYAEILRRPGLFEQVRRDYRVIITGPTTIQAILNSLQMWFRTLVIQKRTSEVWSLLSGLKTDFWKFGDLLEKTHKKIQEAWNTIDDALTKTRTIWRKLDKVQNLPVWDNNPNLITESLWTNHDEGDTSWEL